MTNETWCVCYIRGGKSRIPFSLKADDDADDGRDWNEFIAARQMEDRGLNAWCGRKIEFVRAGKQRKAEAKVSPYLRNYVFVHMPPARLYDLINIKHVARTVHFLRPDDVKMLAQFRKAVEAEYAEGQRVKQNREMIAGYKAGQAIRIVDGRFGDQLLRFKRMVERSFDLFPKIEAEMEMMGRVVTMQLDPLDVRAAG